jgi:hypothetical protein
MNGRNMVANTIIGIETASETCSERCRASDLGASSPNTMCSAVDSVNAMMNEIVVTLARRRPSRAGSAGEVLDRRLREEADAEARHGDAELGRRDVEVEVLEDPLGQAAASCPRWRAGRCGSAGR